MYTLQLHRTEDDTETAANSHLPVTSHSSQLKMKAACNCGRKQADKEDPFNHKVCSVIRVLIISAQKKDELWSLI